MSSSDHVLVKKYLKRLEVALRDVSKDRRREIVGEIEGHINEEIRQLDRTPKDVDIAQILDRVGEPETIAADVVHDSPPRATRLGGLEIAALILLLVGGIFFPFVGWIVGAVLLWVSPAWTTGQKLLGTLVVPGGLALPVYMTVFASGTSSCSTVGSSFVVRPNGKKRLLDSGPLVCESSGTPRWLLITVMTFAAIAAIVTCIYLGRSARRNPSIA